MSDAVVERHDWDVDEVVALHEAALFELIDRARAVHRQTQPGGEVQLCALLSVKTGGCMEDCSYCAQSAHHSTHVEPERMMTVQDVLDAAAEAKGRGSTRLCMGSAGRSLRDGRSLETMVEMIRGVKALGLEACCTLGMLNREQAERLRDAGLDVYNHNLDTSREYYPKIVRTHEYDDRLETLRAVREAGIGICSGGIIGMGESVRDRCAMLVELSSFDPAPESVPINALVPVEGTPLAERPRVRPIEILRLVATARIVMPKVKIRLSAGRQELSGEEQIFCFYAGANSIFFGDRLLTTPNRAAEDDLELIRSAGLVPAPPRGSRPPAL